MKRTLFVKLPISSDKRAILDMMKQYGVVTNLEENKDIKVEKSYTYWKVTYQTDGEYRCAFDCLTIEGIEVKTEKANSPEKKDDAQGFVRNARMRGSERNPLINPDIEMEELSKNLEAKFTRQIDDESLLLNRLKLPAQSCCCNRFCLHFLNYPIKFCCIPRLFWWILLLITCLLIPISIYIIADYLQLESYKVGRVRITIAINSIAFPVIFRRCFSEFICI